jgi:hypothetical protein
MTLQELWRGLRHTYRRANAFLEQFYHLGPAAHGVQGVLREFLDGPPDGVQDLDARPARTELRGA